MKNVEIFDVNITDNHIRILGVCKLFREATENLWTLTFSSEISGGKIHGDLFYLYVQILDFGLIQNYSFSFKATILFEGCTCPTLLSIC